MSQKSRHPLAEYTLDQIADEIERRGFTKNHVADIRDGSWALEHPIRCRLKQLSPYGYMRGSLTEVCELPRMLSQGLAQSFFQANGPGRYPISPQRLDMLLAYQMEKETEAEGTVFAEIVEDEEE